MVKTTSKSKTSNNSKTSAKPSKAPAKSSKTSKRARDDEEEEQAEETEEEEESETGTDGSIESALEELEGSWADTEAPEFEDLPAGNYQVKIDSATINRSKSSGRLQVSWVLTVVSGDHRGRKLFKHDGIEDDGQRGWFKAALAKLGVEFPESAKDLPDTLGELEGSYAQVSVKHKDEYVNVYFTKALDGDDVEDPEESAETEEDENAEEAEGEEAEESEESEEGEEGEESEEAYTPSVGDRVGVEYEDGETYYGKVKKVNAKKQEATIAFEDGETATHPFDACVAADEEEEEEADDESKEEEEIEEGEETEEESEETEEEETEEEGEEEEAESTCEAEFEDDDITKAERKLILELAKTHKFKRDRYDSEKDLLCDIAEHVGVSGSFKKVTKLIAAVQAKKK